LVTEDGRRFGEDGAGGALGEEVACLAFFAALREGAATTKGGRIVAGALFRDYIPSIYPSTMTLMILIVEKDDHLVDRKLWAEEGKAHMLMRRTC
jgi:hypothetical protein